MTETLEDHIKQDWLERILEKDRQIEELLKVLEYVHKCDFSDEGECPICKEWIENITKKAKGEK